MASFHASHLLAWLGFAVGAAIVYVLGVIVYRLYFHPLARYPGPFLARVSSIHQLYHAWKGDRHLEFWRMHQKYGPVVRFSPSSLSLLSASSLREIYSFRAPLRKSDFYDAFVHPAPNTHNTRDREVHARKRRVLAHGFGDAAMREMETYVLQNVRRFCRQIGLAGAAAAGVGSKGWTEGKVMSDWCNYLAMDILGDLCFGKAFHMLESDENRYALDLVSAATRRHLICGTLPTIDKLHIDRVLFPTIAAGRARYMAYSRAQLEERTRLGSDSDRRDFFHHLLRARDPQTGESFSMPELWGESNLLIIAGSDTTSTALCATFFYLTRCERALVRATAEVRARFPALSHIRQGPVLGAQTPYLRACVDEAMRLSPSVGGLLPREVLPGSGGFTVSFGDGAADRITVPEGTVVGTPHYAVMHDERYYPGAWEFAPERWIVGAERTFGGFVGGPRSKELGAGSDTTATVTVTVTVTEEDVARAQSAFCPFSIGPRGCIGKGLAYAEMLTTLARALYLYDLRRPAGPRGRLGEGSQGAEWGRHRASEFQLFDTFTSIKEGPVVEFRRWDGAVVDEELD